MVGISNRMMTLKTHPLMIRSQIRSQSLYAHCSHRVRRGHAESTRNKLGVLLEVVETRLSFATSTLSFATSTLSFATSTLSVRSGVV